MSAITTPDFKCSKQSSHGREERIEFIISEVKKDPAFHFEELAYTPKRCSNVKEITGIIEDMCRQLRLSPNTRKDYAEQILFELKII